jgi:hypothetical protein
MNRGMLPHNVDVYQEDGFWKLRWREDSSGANGPEEGADRSLCGLFRRQAQASYRPKMRTG